MDEAEFAQELQVIVGLMEQVGFVSPTVVTGEHHGEPIAGVRGRWNGEMVESTFVRGKFDATALNTLKLMVVTHPRKHPLRADA